MPTEETPAGVDSEGPVRAYRWAGPLLALACLASLPLCVHAWFDATHDASMYVSLTRSLLAGEGYTFNGQPFQVRPPGLPVLLMPVLVVFGSSFWAWNAYIASWGVAAVLLFYAFERPRLGAPLAAAAGLALWLSPPWQALCNQILAEMPATALLFACLLLDRRWGRSRSFARHFVLGVAIGLAAYVRTVNVLVAPAAIAARLLRAERLEWRALLLRQVAPLALGTLAALAPWSVRNATTDFPVPSDQHPLHSYSAAMWHVDKGDPGSPRISWQQFEDRVALRAPQCLAALGSGLRASEITWPRGLMALVLLGALAVFAVRERATPELFALGTFALLCVYFGFAPRLLLPVFVIALPAFLRMLVALIGGFRGAPRARWALAALVLLWGLASARPRQGWDAIEARHAEIAGRVRQVAALVPPDARLATALGHHYAVYLGRPVLSFRIWGRRRPEAGTVAAIEIIQKHGVEKVFLFDDILTDKTLLRDLGAWYGVERRSASAHILDVSAPLDLETLERRARQTDED